MMLVVEVMLIEVVVDFLFPTTTTIITTITTSSTNIFITHHTPKYSTHTTNTTATLTKMVNFQDAFTDLYKIFFFVSNIMHGREAMNFRICLAPITGYSISAKSYEFYPYFAHRDSLDFTISHIHIY